MVVVVFDVCTPMILVKVVAQYEPDTNCRAGRMSMQFIKLSYVMIGEHGAIKTTLSRYMIPCVRGLQYHREPIITQFPVSSEADIETCQPLPWRLYQSMSESHECQNQKSQLGRPWAAELGQQRSHAPRWHWRANASPS
jgi:hypothetical protein